MEEKNKERYRKGFNHGYSLAEAGIELPKLESKSNSSDKSKNEYIKGIKDGTKELKKEKSKRRVIGMLKDEARISKGRAPSKGKQK